jgi:gas vesicle protein
MAVYDWSKGLVKGLFYGGLIGVVIGLFFTTKRKKGTWEEIGKSADALFDKTQEQVDQAQREIKELSNREKDPSAGGNREDNHQRQQNNL